MYELVSNSSGKEILMFVRKERDNYKDEIDLRNENSRWTAAKKSAINTTLTSN